MMMSPVRSRSGPRPTTAPWRRSCARYRRITYAALLDDAEQLEAPDLFVPEAINIAWKKVMRNRISSAEARFMLLESVQGTEFAALVQYLGSMELPKTQ
jgi:predicted nucleic acid-binding protein